MDERLQKVQNEIKELHEIYKETFSTKSGKAVLEDLKKNCFFYNSTAPESDVTDTNKVMRNEGRRSVILRITQLMDGDKISEELNRLRSVK